MIQAVGISRASAQNLMKAIGEVQVLGGTRFIDRASLLAFLDHTIAAESVDDELRAKHKQAKPVPRAGTLRLSLPEGLRRVTLKDLPENIMLGVGEVRATGPDTKQVVEGLVALAQVMQNDLEGVRALHEPFASSDAIDEELQNLFIAPRRIDQKSLKEFRPLSNLTTV